MTDACIIGPAVTINGRLTGDEPVNVFGRIEGNVQLNNHLVVEEGGQVVAELDVQVLTVRGGFNGDVVAHEVITLESGCVVTGNLKAPRIIIQEGARFKGNIDMDV